MAELPLKVWQDFIWKLRQVNDQAEARIRAYIAKYRIPQTYEEYQQFLDYAYAVSTKFGEAAGEIAAEMYEAEARAAKVIIKAAVPAEPPSIAEVAKTVFGTVKTGNEEIISSAVGRLVKKTGANTTLKNAIRDGAQYAWIPHGDTCAFCIMLASNGWMSGGEGLKNGQAAHIHANCDCTYGVRFDGKSGVAGYDPDKYKEMYDNAEGDTWQEKLNSMRRDEYEKNKDEINARKREAYAEKKGLKDERDDDILKAAEKNRKRPGSDEKALIADLVSKNDYREKMLLAGENGKITDIMTYQARTTLYRRNGTPYEDMIYINPITGEVLTQRGIDIPGEVKPTEEMKRLVLNNPRKIIGMHNHPHNNLPSYDDLSSAKRYKYGITLCHDGKVVKYTVDKNADLYTADALLELMQVHLSENRDISGELSLLRDLGVEMEVF